MKKLLALMLALILCLSCAFAENDTNDDLDEQERVEADENEVGGYGYIDPYQEYYVVVPAGWTLIGVGSTQANLEMSREILSGSGLDADELYQSLNPKDEEKRNQTLICLTSDLKHGMILTFGASEFVSNSDLIDQMSEVQQAIKAENPSIRFVDAQCGSYSFNSLENILRLRMISGENTIEQYFLISGKTLYLFSFMNPAEDDISAVFYFFRTGVTEFDSEVSE